jgi:hypothetical protein
VIERGRASRVIELRFSRGHLQMSQSGHRRAFVSMRIHATGAGDRRYRAAPMALVVETRDAADLLSAIDRLIEDGTIRSWVRDGAGCFRHAVEPWANRARLRARPIEEGLHVTIQGSPSGLSQEALGVYFGRFAEMVLTHFGERCTVIAISPSLQRGDEARAGADWIDL